MGARRVGLFVAAGSVVTGLTVVACFPAFDFSGEAAGAGAADAGGDGTVGTGGGVEGGGPDAPGSAEAAPGADVVVAPPLPPDKQVILASVGIGTETGNAQQQHLVFAKNSGRYWFFYVDAEATKVKTRWSTDLATWTDGNALTLPMPNGGEGRNLSVAYRNFGGRDVVHVATSLHGPLKRVVWDTRATIAADVITFGATALVHDLDELPDGGYADAGELGGDGCDPDGNGVAIAADGHVYVATAWLSIPGNASCDANFGKSTAVDDGTSWDGDAGFTMTHFTVPGVSNAHQVLALAGGDLLGGWEDADGNPASNVRWVAASNGTWGASDYYDTKYAVFPIETPPAVQAENDWSMCRITDASIHVMRRKHAGSGGTGTDSVFEHSRWNGAGWTFQAALAAETGLEGSGVVLLTNGAGLLAATIAADAAASVRYATWDGASSAWSAWQTLVGSDAGATHRAFLSGSGCDDPAHPVLTWTEGTSAPYRVVGVPVGALFP